MKKGARENKIVRTRYSTGRKRKEEEIKKEEELWNGRHEQKKERKTR